MTRPSPWQMLSQAVALAVGVMIFFASGPRSTRSLRRRASHVTSMALAFLTLGLGSASAQTGTISGLVTDTNGIPQGSVTVQVFNAAGVQVASVLTSNVADTLGTYTTNPLAVDNYYVRALVPAGSFLVGELYDDLPCTFSPCTPTTGTAVQVADQATATANFVLTLGGRISGIVTDNNGLPIAGVIVLVSNSNGQTISGNTNAFGAYSIPSTGLAPGDYFVRTSNSLGYVNELYDNLPCVPSCTVTTGTPVSVTGGQTTSNINFALIFGSEPVSAQPVIRSVVPDNGAAGQGGQIITIQGFGLIAAGGLPATLVTFTHRATGATCNDLFKIGAPSTGAPSTANELYVRLSDLSCEIAPGVYHVEVSTTEGVSNRVGFQVRSKPGRPILRRFSFRGETGCPDLAVAVTYHICVQAYGTNLGSGAAAGSSTVAVFSQGNTEFPPEPLQVRITGFDLGLTHGFRLPAGLISGQAALVQLRTTVVGQPSDLSFALVFTVP